MVFFDFFNVLRLNYFLRLCECLNYSVFSTTATLSKIIPFREGFIALNQLKCG